MDGRKRSTESEADEKLLQFRPHEKACFAVARMETYCKALSCRSTPSRERPQMTSDDLRRFSTTLITTSSIYTIKGLLLWTPHQP